MVRKHSKTERKKRQSRRKSTKRTAINFTSLSYSIFEEAVQALGISHLNLSQEELRKIVKAVLENMLSNINYKPSRSVIISRLLKSRIRLAPIITEQILIFRKSLDEELLEYVINYGGPVAAANVQRLYREALEKNREDLINILRNHWKRYGSSLQLVQCPYCKFAAVQPNFICFVCGKRIKVEEFKEIIDFESLLEMFIEFSFNSELKKIEEYQAIVYDPEEGLKPPPPEGDKIQYIIPLSEREIEIILEQKKPREVKVELPLPREIRKRKVPEETKEKISTLDAFLKKQLDKRENEE